LCGKSTSAVTREGCLSVCFNDWRQKRVAAERRPLVNKGGTTMRKIEVVDYNPAWPWMFELERESLHRVLGVVAIAIHHIGSTSVPGLSAKSVIDIIVEATSVADTDCHESAMTSIEYEAKGEFGIPGRRFFQKGGDNRTHHVHAFAQGDPYVWRHIAFRDYLTRNPLVAREYDELKRRVAQGCHNDIEVYCHGKDAFIKRIEAIAMKFTQPRHVTTRR
jgi:GrpB-like predicted nucleotidyltransferase (UPF0157 family)